MRRNLQMWDTNNGESEGINRSYSEHLLMDLRKTVIPIVEDCISKGGIHSVEQVVDDSFQKLKDEIHSMVEEKLIYQNWNSKDEATTPVPRDFELKFLVQVSDPVLTGKEIRGKEGTDIKIAIVDKVTEVPVGSGPQSSAKVEIYILDASVEDFDDSINIANDKPYFRNRVFVDLKKGVGILPKNVKLAHRSHWTKSCKCRLGARVVKNLDGSRIKEALTETFTVLDRRCQLYQKHDQPSLFDELWRLKNIGKDGARCNRLLQKNVSTVQEFLFLHSVDPRGLQKIFGASPDRIWMSTVNHARKCDINDKKIYLHCSSSSSDCKNGVVFDVVGQLKGVLRNNIYVPIESVAEAGKDDARKLLACAFENQKEAPASENKKKASAFENWNDIASFDDEASFLGKFPSSIVENIDRYGPTRPSTLSQSQGIGPSINHSNGSCHFGPLSSIDVLLSGESSFETPGEGQRFSSSDWDSFWEIFLNEPLSSLDLDSFWENLENEPLLSPTFSNNDNIHRVESYSDQQSSAGSIRFAGGVITLRWLVRVRKRVASLGDTQAHKRQRQSDAIS